jgi:dienelactone hydrolase
MKKAVVFFALLAGFTAALAERVNFAVTPSLGATLVVSGELEKPAGEGPFPAIVMLHGCGGPWPLRDDMWSRRMVDWGYVVLRVDSFEPRGFPEGICEHINSVSPLARAEDAHAAKAYLKKLHHVDGSNIAVMGWSHGGMSVLWAAQNTYIVDTVRSDPFKAAIAMYPWCEPILYRVDAPLLLLIGELDDWTPSSRCERMKLMDPVINDMTLKVYAGATHDFDVPGLDTEVLGHALRYNPDAAADAQIRIEAFLSEHLE